MDPKDITPSEQKKPLTESHTVSSHSETPGRSKLIETENRTEMSRAGRGEEGEVLLHRPGVPGHHEDNFCGNSNGVEQHRECTGAPEVKQNVNE